MGQSHNIEYQISLKDLLSGKIKDAEGNVNHFEKSLQHTHDLTKQMASAAVGFFGLYQGVEFVKSSVEEFNQVARAISQIKAGLESTKGVAGLTFEDMTEQAEKFQKATVFDDDVLYDMQAQLLSFHNISKNVFEDVSQAVMDIATRTGKDLHETSIAVGKAFNDPSTGLGALRRYGVQFDEQANKQIEHLLEKGKLLEAQKQMIAAIRVDYEGSAAAFADTDLGKLQQLQRSFKDVKQELGKLVMEETIKHAPAIKHMIEQTKDLVHWLDDNKGTLISVGKAIVGVTAATWAFGKATAGIEGAIALWGSLKNAVTGASAAMAGANAASVVAADASILSTAAGVSVGGAVVAEEAAVGAGFVSALAANPVGIAIVASAASLAGIYELTEYIAHRGEKIEKSNAEAAAHEVYNERVNHGIKDLASESMAHMSNSEFFARRQNDLHGTAYEDILEQHLLNGDKAYKNLMLSHSKELFSDLLNAKNTLELVTPKSGSEHFQPILEFLDAEYKKFNAHDRAAKTANTKTDATLKAQRDSVQGQRIVNNYITIKELVHQFEVKTTNIKESVPNVRRLMTEALTDALNDAQITDSGQ